MKSTKKNLRVVMMVFIALFALLIIYFTYAVNTYGGRWFSNSYNSRLRKQEQKVIAGNILDRDGEVLATTDSDGNRVYHNDKQTRLAISHVVGDNAALTLGGAERLQAKYLLGFDTNIIERIYQQFTSGKTKGSNVVLTIDASLSKYVSEQMGSYDGAVALINYRTGEVISMVSHPMFDPEDIEDYIADEDGNISGNSSALVNRVTMGQYTPGSVYKIVTTVAAMRYMPDALTRTWDCDGPLVFDKKSEKYLSNVHFTEQEDKEYREQQSSGTSAATEEEDEFINNELLDSGGSIGDFNLLRDYQSNYHGAITLKEAFAVSCNHTFAQIAMEIGGSKMEKTAKSLGIGTDFMFSDMLLYGSSYDAGSTEYNLGWSAIGQHKDIMTPMQMALIAGMIGNDGVMMEPKLLRGVVNSRDYTYRTIQSDEYKSMLTSEEAETITGIMRYCITNGTGSSAAVKGYSVCGKTGTAEVSSNKAVGNHAWFVGFIDDSDHPLAIAVVLEHAGSGGGKAAPVAGEILKKAIQMGY